MIIRLHCLFYEYAIFLEMLFVMMDMFRRLPIILIQLSVFTLQ